MEFRVIEECSRDEKALKALFLEAFPPDERPPYFILRRNAKKPGVEFCGIYDGGRLIGLTYVLHRADIAYLFFLAIVKELRGQGYGSLVMAALLQKYQGDRFFLALEPLDESADNYAQRLSRHRFYERCGLRDMPYRLKEGPVTYAVMGVGGEVRAEEYRALIDQYMGAIMKRTVDMRLIPQSAPPPL